MERFGNGNDDSDDESMEDSQNMEHALAMALRRLRVISCRLEISKHVGGDDEEKLFGLCKTLASFAEKELGSRQSTQVNGKSKPAGIWKDSESSQPHETVAEMVKDIMQFILTQIGWCVRQVIVLEGTEGIQPMDETEPGDQHIVVSLRELLVELVASSFEHFVEESDDLIISPDHSKFSDQVQINACSVLGDLRSLLLKEWSTAASPTLRSFAFTDDTHVIGGFIRFVTAKEEQVRTYWLSRCRRARLSLLSTAPQRKHLGSRPPPPACSWCDSELETGQSPRSWARVVSHHWIWRHGQSDRHGDLTCSQED